MNLHEPSQNFEAKNSKSRLPLKNKSRGYDLRALAKIFETDSAFKKARADVKLFDALSNDGLNETR